MKGHIPKHIREAKNKSAVSGTVRKLLENYEKGSLKDYELLGEIFSKTPHKEMEHLLQSLFSMDEVKIFTNRLLVVKMLKDETPQHKISEKLKVGVATVTRGSREIEKGRFKFI